MRHIVPVNMAELRYQLEEDRKKREYEELKKENPKLKEQIERMKCCGNCRHLAFNNGTDWCTKNDTNLFECDLSKDWELKE